MAKNKNQHFVPKSHLKSFAVDESGKQINVWLHKSDKIIHGASIKDQCPKSYIYGKDLKIEKWLQQPEQVLSKLIKETGDSTNVDKQSLAQLLFLWVLQFIRSERALKDNLVLYNTVRDVVSVGPQGSQQLMDWLGPPADTQEAMQMSLDNGAHLFKAVADLRCVILNNRSHIGLVMSDNPAVSSNKLYLMRYRKYWNWGLGNAGVFLYLPLSPSHAFLAYDKNVYELAGRQGNQCSIDSRDATALNQMLYLHANNAVVLPPSSNEQEVVDSLKDVSHLKPEVLGRINFALEDEGKARDGKRYFLPVSQDAFMASRKGGLIHFEQVPPRISKHFPKLLLRQRPRFKDKGAGSGLERYGTDLAQLAGRD